MSDTLADLDRIQHWLQAVIMHPAGVAGGIASPPARELLNVSPADLEQVVTRSQALPALERLAIYGNAYQARLLECLRDEFPVLLHALGDELYDAFALAYLQKYPSRSYTLNKLADRFPQFLRETRPDDGDEPDSPLSSWPDFLIDLATLELTFNEVFDGPGIERAELLDAARLQAVPPDCWPAARLIPVPCLRVLAFHFPVHEYYSAVRRNEDPPPPGAAETFLAVTRRNYVVRHCPLSRLEHDLLRNLIAGQSVAQAIESAAQQGDAACDELTGNIHAWFARWASEGFFLAVDAGSGS